MSGPRSGADVLARTKPVVREVSTNICLRPDLLDAWEAANDALTDAQAADTSGGRLSSGVSTATRKLAQKVTEIEAEIDATQVNFTFRALPKDKWYGMLDEFPPRTDNQLDNYVGYDRDAVLNEAVRRCMIDPVFEVCTVTGCTHDECGTWEAFLKVLNHSEWDELRGTVNACNSAVVDAPKSELASRILGSPGSASKPRKRGA